MQQDKPSDFVIDRIWCGPGKGAALQIRHLPTAISVRRDIGYDPDKQHRVELLEELQRKIRAHDDSVGRDSENYDS